MGVSIHRPGSAPSEAPFNTFYHLSPSMNGSLKGVSLPLLRLAVVLDLGPSPQSSDILCLSPFLPSSDLQRLDSHTQRPYQISQAKCRSNPMSTSIVSQVAVLQLPGARKTAMSPTAEASMIRPICSALGKSRSSRYVAHAPSTPISHNNVAQQQPDGVHPRYVGRDLY